MLYLTRASGANLNGVIANVYGTIGNMACKARIFQKTAVARQVQEHFTHAWNSKNRAMFYNLCCTSHNLPGIVMVHSVVLAFRHYLLGLLLLSACAWSAPGDPAAAVRDAIAQGADASQVIELLQERNIPMGDAIVIAIANSPEQMAGDLTLAAMAKVPSEQQEEIAYQALSVASGEGFCAVTAVMGMPQTGACAQ
jgi:hypothetical protein